MNREQYHSQRKSEFTDQVDSTTQFINWAKASLGWSKSQREQEEKDRQERIAKGLPIGHNEKGERIYACAYRGCGKELPAWLPTYWARGLPFCSMIHSW
jgi:hypothetical protein